MALARAVASMEYFKTVSKSFHKISLILLHFFIFFGLLNYVKNWNEDKQYVFIVVFASIFICQFCVTCTMNYYKGKAVAEADEKYAADIGAYLGYMVYLGNCAGGFIGIAIAAYKKKMF